MLRGHATLQDIVGRRQNFKKSARSGNERTGSRRNIAADNNVKSDGLASATSQPLHKHSADQAGECRSKEIKACTSSYQLRSPFAESQGAVIDTIGSAALKLRRSPRQAASSTRSKSENLRIDHNCPVCNRSLPQDTEQINRHLGKALPAWYSTAGNLLCYTPGFCMLTCSECTLQTTVWPRKLLPEANPRRRCALHGQPLLPHKDRSADQQSL
jgi:hypothetical protein